MGIRGTAVRHQLAVSSYAGQERPRTLARANVLPDTDELSTIGQNASTRVNADLCYLVGTDGLGCWPAEGCSNRVSRQVSF